MNASWIVPFIILGGALQTCGAAMNGHLNKSLVNPYLVSAVSFLVIKAGHVNLKLALLIAVGFAVGGWFGGLWAQHLSDVVLRRSFAVLLVALAIKLAIGR